MSLPAVLDLVMQYMNLETQVVVASASKDLGQTVDDPKRWRDQFIQDFGVAVESRVLQSPLQRKKSNEQRSFWKQAYLLEREADLLEAAGIYGGLC
jgi:hypothetical protein